MVKPIKKLLIVFIMILAGCTGSDEDGVVVVTDGQGCFNVKLDGDISSLRDCFETYQEAAEYGAIWEKEYRKNIIKRNKDWKKADISGEPEVKKPL